MKKNSLLAGLLFCLISVLAWGGMFPVMESALKFIDPFYFTAIRYGVASIIFLLLLVAIEGTQSLNFEGRILSLLFFGSAGFAGFGFLVFYGQQIISGPSGAVTASTIMATMPLMSALIGWIATGKKPGIPTFLAIVFAFIGVLLVITNGNISILTSLGINVMADLFILLGAFCWVIYTWGASKFKDWSPLRYTALSCLFGVVSIGFIIFIMTIAGILHLPTIPTVFEIKWQLFYMIVIAAVIAVFTWNAGNKIIGPINGVLFINMVPVTALFVIILLGQKITIIQIMGSVIVIISLVGNNFYQRISSKLAKEVVTQNLDSNEVV